MPRIIHSLQFRDRWEGGIFFAGLALRLAVFVLILFAYGAAGLGAFNDSQEYLQLADGIANRHAFMNANPVGLLEVVRPPGYPAYLSFFIASGLPLRLAVLIQVIALSFVPILTMRLAERFGFSKRVRRLAGSFAAFEPLQVYYSALFLTDGFAVLFFLIGACLLVRFWQEGKRRDLITSAIVMGGVNYIRPTGLFMFILIPLCMIIGSFVLDRARWKWHARSALLYGIIFYLVLVPWMARNYIHFGAFKFTSGLERQLYDYAAVTVRATAEKVPYDIMQERMRNEVRPFLPEPIDLKRFANGPVLAERAKAVIFAHPREYTKLYLMSLQTLLVSGNYHFLLANYHIIPWPPGGTQSFTILFSGRDFGHAFAAFRAFLREPYGIVAILGKLVWLGMLLLAFWGAASAWRRESRSRFGMILWVGFLVYLAMVTFSLVGGVEARHRIFLDPFTFIFTAAGIAVAARWRSRKRPRPFVKLVQTGSTS